MINQIDLNIMYGFTYACCADKNPYRHDPRADKNPYRHDRRADKNPYRYDRRADSQCRLGYTSWPLRSSKEISLFIEDVTERTCSHSSLGCLEIRSRIFRLRV